MSVARINEFQARSEKTEELRDFLNSIIPMIQSSNGCESCRLLQSQDDPTKFVVIEIWSGVEAHKESARKIPPEKVGQVMQLLASPPGGSYYST